MHSERLVFSREDIGYEERSLASNSILMHHIWFTLTQKFSPISHTFWFLEIFSLNRREYIRLIIIGTLLRLCMSPLTFFTAGQITCRMPSAGRLIIFVQCYVVNTQNIQTTNVFIYFLKNYQRKPNSLFRRPQTVLGTWHDRQVKCWLHRMSDNLLLIKKIN